MIQRMHNPQIAMVRYVQLSYDISETTKPIDKKFHNNIWTKMCPAMQYWCHNKSGRSPFWRWPKLPHLSLNSPILMKLGTLHEILNLMTATWPKIEIFKIQDGGGRHLQNRFFGHYSSTDCLISAKFCTRKQKGMSTTATVGLTIMEWWLTLIKLKN